MLSTAVITLYSMSVHHEFNAFVSSERRLQFGDVPLVHAVMSDELVWTSKLFLTARPTTGKRLLTWDGETTGSIIRSILSMITKLRKKMLLINLSSRWGRKGDYALVLPVWVRVWVLRWSERENFLWHVSHWKGFTPTRGDKLRLWPSLREKNIFPAVLLLPSMIGYMVYVNCVYLYFYYFIFILHLFLEAGK